jgi:prepilin-type N-terminal cleavage/methylation domain-containing protein
MFQIGGSKLDKNKNGFTLLEILIAISIFFIILSITISITRSFSDTVNLDNAGKIIGTNIKLAKTRSISALNDTNYGVHFEDNYIVVFEGSDYDAGDLTNKVVDLPDGVEIEMSTINLAENPTASGYNLIFDRLTGATNNFGTIKIRLIKNPSEEKQIVINSEGQVDYTLFQTSSGSPIKNARHVHYNLVWNIENSTILRFEWVDEYSVSTINDIDATAYFNADKSEFDWHGEIIEGSSQTLGVRGWLDASDKTVLCVIRDQTETKTLHIYFIDGGTTKKIATYANVGGIINVTPDGFNVQAMTIK